MRRLVLAIVILEVVSVAVMALASRSEGTDAAGRGLAAAYLLAFAAPVLLATLAWLAGSWRLAGAFALVLPAMFVFLRFSSRAESQQDKTEDWFGDPRVTALLTALASPDPAALSPFAGRRDVLNAMSTDSSRTLLTFASRQYPGKVGALIELGADPNLSPVHGLHPVIAAFDEPPLVLRQLLMNGANPNAELRPGEPALHQALWQRKREHARLLIEHGANIEMADRLGRSPIYAAVDNYEWGVALQLLERGADPRRATSAGKTLQSLLGQPDWKAWHDDRAFQSLVDALRARGVDIVLPAP